MPASAARAAPRSSGGEQDRTRSPRAVKDCRNRSRRRPTSLQSNRSSGEERVGRSGAAGGTSMGIAPERTVLPSVASSVPSLGIQSRALRALPLTALVVDVVLVTATVLLATYS